MSYSYNTKATNQKNSTHMITSFSNINSQNIPNELSILNHQRSNSARELVVMMDLSWFKGLFPSITSKPVKTARVTWKSRVPFLKENWHRKVFLLRPHSPKFVHSLILLRQPNYNFLRPLNQTPCKASNSTRVKMKKRKKKKEWSPKLCKVQDGLGYSFCWISC